MIVALLVPAAAADSPNTCTANQKVGGVGQVHVDCREPDDHECLLKAIVLGVHVSCPNGSNLPTRIGA